jgi:hypothetical protein
VLACPGKQKLLHGGQLIFPEITSTLNCLLMLGILLRNQLKSTLHIQVLHIKLVQENIRFEWCLINPYCNHLLQVLSIWKSKTIPGGKLFYSGEPICLVMPTEVFIISLIPSLDFYITS